MLFLVHSCTKKVSAWATPKLKNNSFCCKNNKADHKVSKKFLFYQNTMCFSFLFCDVFFLVKKGHLQLKQLWLYQKESSFRSLLGILLMVITVSWISGRPL